MIDFPNSPTNGQVFTSGARSWTWDTTKWQASTGAPSPITNINVTAPITGGGSSGAVTIGMTNPLPVVNGGTGAATGPLALTSLGAVAKAGDTMTGDLTVNAVVFSKGPTAQFNFAERDNPSNPWIWYANAASARLIRVGGADLLTINSAGAVGFPTMPPSDAIAGTIFAGQIQLSTMSSNAYYTGSWKRTNTAPTSIFATDGNGDFRFYTAAGGASGGVLTLAERMCVLNANGNVGIGTTGPNYRLHAVNAAGANFVAAVFNTSGAAGDKGMVISAGLQGSDTLTKMIEFYDSGPGYQGAIQRTGANGVAYNSASDARMKENIVTTGSSLAVLMSVLVRDFNFKGEPGRTRQGFIAQELHEVYPDAVSVGGDDVKTTPWSVEYGRLTPLLVKALQEAVARIEALEARS